MTCHFIRRGTSHAIWDDFLMIERILEVRILGGTYPFPAASGATGTLGKPWCKEAY